MESVAMSSTSNLCERDGLTHRTREPHVGILLEPVHPSLQVLATLTDRLRVADDDEVGARSGHGDVQTLDSREESDARLYRSCQARQ